MPGWADFECTEIDGGKMYQNIIFDLDGTLTDPKEGICKAVQYALKKDGIIVNNLDELEPFIGPPLSESFEEFYGYSHEAALHAVETYREYYGVTGLFENVVYEGIENMLKNLKEAGITLAIASSKPKVFIDRILKKFDLTQYFDLVVGASLDGSLGKKNDIVKKVLEQLGALEKKEILEKTAMVGDRKFDVCAAIQFGMVPIAVGYGYGSKEELTESGAEIIVDSVEALEVVLRK